MKYLVTVNVILIFTSCSNCNKEKPPTCSDQPPTNELCLAHFNRWFYDEGSNSCQLIGYSGCNFHGFETQQECEACLCD